MRITPKILRAFAVFALIPILVSAQSQDPKPAPPFDYDSTAKVPPNLPKTLDIPRNMRINVKVWRKKPLPIYPPVPNDISLLMDPDLESAVIERAQEDVHVTFHWQGEQSSEAFIIHGLCFRKPDLRYPDLMIASGPALNF